MRLVKVALPVLFLAALALFGLRAWTASEDRAARSLALEHARAQFLARAAVARAAPDEVKYHAELRQLLRAWFAERTDLGNRWPQLRAEPAPFTPPPPRAKGGDLREFQEFADQTVGAWREGRLDLVQTVSAGGLRVDVLAVAREKGKPQLAVDLAVWGAPEELEVEESQGKVQQKSSVPLSFRGLSLRFFGKEGQLIAEMPGVGEPSLRIDLPARLVPDAPPGVVLARYEPGLFPAEAAELEWTITASVRTATGETRPVVASFRTKANPAWAVGATEAWGGTERTSEEAAIPGAKKTAGSKGSGVGAKSDEPARPSAWPARADAVK